MVEVKVFQDGELMGEYDGDYAVCIVSSRTERKGELCRKVSYAGNPPLKELRAALADGAARVLAVTSRRKGESMEKACEVMAKFSADTMIAGAKALLDVYEEDDDEDNED